MSGLCVCLAARPLPGARDVLATTAATFTGPNASLERHVGPGIAMVVCGRHPRGALNQSFGAIDEDEGIVLAAEGFFTDLERYAEDSGASRGRVLIQLFRRHGAAIFSRLRGSFQVVVFDTEARRCTAGASRFAERILYRARTRDGWVFCSEAKAIPLWTGESPALDSGGLYLAFGHGDTVGARTLFRGVTRLEPGTCQILNAGGAPRVERLPEPPVERAELPWDTWVERSDSLMRDTLKRLTRVNDDPKAVLMGSGIDSAVVAGALKQATGSVHIVTQAMPGAMNEAPGASRTARGLQARHHVFAYEPHRVSLVSQLRQFVQVTESPVFWAQLGAPMVTLSAATSGLARTFFLGIMSDNLMEYGSRQSGPWKVAHRAKEALRTAVRLGGAHFDRRYFRARADLVRASALRRHLAYAHKNLLADRLADGVAELYSNQWLNVRTTTKLMQFHGGEALLPYVDLEVIRHFMAMPYSHRHEKKILHALLHRYMPPEYAPLRKTGFGANAVRWHQEAGNLGEALDLLTEARTRWRGIYEPAHSAGVIERFRKGPVADPKWCEALYQWLLFELFCRELVDVRRPAIPGAAQVDAA